MGSKKSPVKCSCIRLTLGRKGGTCRYTLRGNSERRSSVCRGKLEVYEENKLLSAGPQDAVRIGGRKDFVGISVIG